MIRTTGWTIAFLLCTPAALAADDPAIPHFVAETAESGIVSSYTGEWEFMVGGGVAVFDCNADHFPDAFFAGGTSPAKLFRNISAEAGPLRFELAESGAGLDRVTGAWPLDIDSDGLMDLVLLRSGENVVMRGLGECRFTRTNEDWGFDGGDAWSTSFSATWENGMNWPTLAIGNYIDRKEDIFPWGSCTDNWLHRPESGDARHFAPPLPLKPSFCALSMLFTDWNRSGTPSLRVSNDREYYKGGQEQLWHIDAGKPPALYTEPEGWKRLRIWGMGIASADIDDNGYPDYFLTSMADNKLQMLASTEKPLHPAFRDDAFRRGTIAQRPYAGGDVHPSTAWHAEFEDVNNDGLLDLFIAKGNVTEMPDFAQRDPNNLLLQKTDGTFVEAGETAGVLSFATARGGALADFNRDGRIDLLVVNRHANAEIWRNITRNAGNWLSVRLEQPTPNRDAIGAWIEIEADGRVQHREIFSGGGHAGGKNGFWHFGLGSATSAKVRVQWPDGTWSPVEEFLTNQHLVLLRMQNSRSRT